MACGRISAPVRAPFTFGDFQQVTGYLVRLERQIADWERPSVFVRTLRALQRKLGP